VFSHVTLGSNDLDRSRRFYDAVMKVLGHKLLFELPQAFAYGEATGPKLFILPPFDGKEARPGNGVHAAFKVESRATVDAFHATAMAHGGTDEGKPGLRPHYHPNYYGAYARDPDGNKIQAVCHRKDG
jgi:catechol 2,3-dioxygenase-like lactoylglutathione lyase family enzyme